jgi:hypothetical protein
MGKKRRLEAGVGAKCTILTKFIHPKKTGLEEGHRTTCFLTESKTVRVNRRDQLCYFFVEGDDQFYAVKSHFKVLEEGEKSKFFDAAARNRPETVAFKEPKIKWRKSKAKRILYDFLRDGTVPLHATDSNGDSTMSVEDIFSLSEEFGLYDPNKFEERLNRLRKGIVELDSRAATDRKAFDIYRKNHEVSLYSHKGYIQWQGSDAQELLWDDIEAGKLDEMTKDELWRSRSEYQNEFPLFAFRKKVEQEIRTAKYVHTLREKGVQHPSS